MSFVSLVFDSGVAKTSIGAITLDALLDESTELNSTATKYVVEDGAPISDHVMEESESLALSGWVTAADTELFGAGGRSKLITAKDALRAIHKSRQPITVVTGMDTYTDMVMERCKIGRDGKGEFFEIQCQLVKIRKATLRTADIPRDRVSASGNVKGKVGATKTKAGKASPTEPTPRQKTDLRRILGAFS